MRAPHTRTARGGRQPPEKNASGCGALASVARPRPRTWPSQPAAGPGPDPNPTSFELARAPCRAPSGLSAGRACPTRPGATLPLSTPVPPRRGIQPAAPAQTPPCVAAGGANKTSRRGATGRAGAAGCNPRPRSAPRPHASAENAPFMPRLPPPPRSSPRRVRRGPSSSAVAICAGHVRAELDERAVCARE